MVRLRRLSCEVLYAGFGSKYTVARLRSVMAPLYNAKTLRRCIRARICDLVSERARAKSETAWVRIEPVPGLVEGMPVDQGHHGDRLHEPEQPNGDLQDQ